MRGRRVVLLAVLALALRGVSGHPLAAEILPSATFHEELLARGLNGPIAIDLLPDGRILVTQQAGELLVVAANGGVPRRLFRFASVNSEGERGLLGVAVDPLFEENGFVYLFYTTNSGGLHNRISRLRLVGGEVVGGEVVLFDFPTFSNAIWHMGGAMRFGADGALYIGVGDHRQRQAAQNLGLAFGKVHRILRDGSVPPDNPYVGVAGALPSIYALGLRNPFSLDFDRSTGELLVNDVGESTWEEVNLVRPGANYGWPESEGPDVNDGESAPLYAYRHRHGACAITGGATYPEGGDFPPDHWGRYLFIDFCAGWIRELDRSTGAVSTLLTGLDFPTALRVDREGRLLYLTRGEEGGGGEGAGRLLRLGHDPQPTSVPTIVRGPEGQLVGVGDSASFAVVATGATGYRWLRDGVEIAGESLPALRVQNVTLADDGALFTAVVSNPHGTVTSAAAELSVSSNRAPEVLLESPAPGGAFDVGSVLTIAGSAVDPEDGPIPPERLRWRIDLHHDAHAHPLVAATPWSPSTTWVVPPEVIHDDGLIWLEVILLATDSRGRIGQRSAHLFPSATLTGENESVLALRGGAYLASLELQNPLTGLPQSATAASATADSGGFWFFAPGNRELLLKVIDGTAANGCRWLFFGSLSDVEFDFFVVETASGKLRVYSNLEGDQASFGDIEAFCGATAPAAPPIVETPPASPALDLLGGRFRATVAWRVPWNGASGAATSAPATDESGFFTFFDPANLEMAVKMVDGTGFNGHYWVYWTALTNLETELTIEDRWTGRVRTFRKDGLEFGAGADVAAFPAGGSAPLPD